MMVDGPLDTVMVHSNEESKIIFGRHYEELDTEIKKELKNYAKIFGAHALIAHKEKTFDLEILTQNIRIQFLEEKLKCCEFNLNARISHHEYLKFESLNFI